MMHILKQFIFHYGWAIVFVGLIGFALDFWSQKNRKAAVWLGANFETHMLIAAFVVSTFLPIRESWDAWRHNQLEIKTPFDYASWYLGSISGAWLFYRLRLWILRRRVN